MAPNLPKIPQWQQAMVPTRPSPVAPSVPKRGVAAASKASPGPKAASVAVEPARDAVDTGPQGAASDTRAASQLGPVAASASPTGPEAEEEAEGQNGLDNAAAEVEEPGPVAGVSGDRPPIDRLGRVLQEAFGIPPDPPVGPGSLRPFDAAYYTPSVEKYREFLGSATTLWHLELSLPAIRNTPVSEAQVRTFQKEYYETVPDGASPGWLQAVTVVVSSAAGPGEPGKQRKASMDVMVYAF